MGSKARAILIAVIAVVVLGAGTIVFVILSQRGPAPSTFVGPTTVAPTAPTPAPEPVPTVPVQPPKEEAGAPPPPLVDRTERCQGPNPIALTIDCSKKAFVSKGTAQTVYIGRDGNPVDAFVATPLMGIVPGPFLATDTNSISSATITEIGRVLPSKSSPIEILGGVAAVSDKVIDQLVSAGYARSNIERISGQNRHETATKIAEKIMSIKTVQTAFVTEDQALVDAYGVAPAASGNLPNQNSVSVILLTNRGSKSLNPTTAAFLSSNPNLNIVTIVGGEAVVTPSVESQINALPSVLLVKRIAGGDRVFTNYRILQAYFFNPTEAYIANAFPNSGTNGLYSAQAGASMAALNGEPLIMTRPDVIGEEQRRFFLCVFADDIYLARLAGDGTDLSPTLEAEVSKMIAGNSATCAP